MQSAENRVSEVLIKRRRLERIAVEPDTLAAARTALSFGSLHQPAAVALTAQVFADPDKLDLQPSGPGEARQPSDNLSIVIAHKQRQRAKVTPPGAHHVVLVDLVLEKLHVRRVGIVGDKHGAQRAASVSSSATRRSRSAYSAAWVRLALCSFLSLLQTWLRT